MSKIDNNRRKWISLGGIALGAKYNAKLSVSHGLYNKASHP